MKLERPHIALVGFMGAGKSSVGKTLAARCGYRFVDLDEVIAESSGQTIPEIFAEHGEVGFRARERAALRVVLAESTPAIIATGGGTFVDPSMRDVIQRSARTVFLKATVEVLLERIGDTLHQKKRPLLLRAGRAGPDPSATVRRLLAQRAPAYEQSEITVTTNGVTIDDVAEELMRLLRLTPPNVAERRRRHDGQATARPSGARPLLKIMSRQGAYPVELRRDAGAWIANGIVEGCRGSRIAVISDTTVAPLHADRIVADLEAHGKKVTLHTFPPGEGSKTLDTAARLYDELLTEGFGRDDAVVAVGGGVVGDVTGFVASTILRGIRYFQVPTSTLAAVDSSVGGKTGVNTPRGKNMVGTFHAPRGVYIAASHLATQDKRQNAAGLAEALKMAATLDLALFEDIERAAADLLELAPEPLLGILSRAVQLKAAVVARDETETGDRAVLNFGHTIGHAIESGERYRLLHGEAVALGMVAESEWAVGEGMARGVSRRLIAALDTLGLPTDWRRARIDSAAMSLDKKRLGTGVRIPLVPRLGSFELRTVPLTAIAEFVKRRTEK